MRESLKDYEHLLRLGLLFVGGFVVFLILRAFLVPEGFGEIGHYRVGAIEDNRALPVTFAGSAACLECHPDAGEATAQGAHAGVRCEACHGALAAHASDPSASPAERPEASTLCAVCHTKNVAKPEGFPQVDPVEHAEGMSCTDCHDAHRPDAG